MFPDAIKNMTTLYDVAIIGGGINGCGCAADAALRGLSVILLEQGDLASQTSSSSTKLIHGGLRYLENYEFSLVKKALEERQYLLNVAQHLVVPQPLVLPWQQGMRPAWMLRAGLFLYDHLSSKNALLHSQSIQMPHAWLAPLQQSFSRGFIFYDAKTDDARLTLENALQAEKHGARIATYARFHQARVENNIWHLEVLTEQGAEQIKAKSIINTSGPWVNQVAAKMHIPTDQSITLVKGSHIVIPALYSGEQGYLLQHEDKRIVFVLPFHGHSMVGTTDVVWNGPLEKPTIDAAEITYLCKLVNHIFQKQTQPSDVLYSWSGLRTLLSQDNTKAAALSRDYSFQISQNPGLAVTVYGGKLTTYRKLSEEILDKLAPLLNNNAACTTKSTPLPGAVTVKNNAWDDYKKTMTEKYDWLDSALLNRYLKTYGTRTSQLLASCQNMQDLGEPIGHGLYQLEVIFLMQHEWAKTWEDILWRRTRLGLLFDASEIAALKPLKNRSL